MRLPLFFEDVRYWVRAIGFVLLPIGVAWLVSGKGKITAESATMQRIPAQRLVAATGLLSEAGLYVAVSGIALVGILCVTFPRRKR